MIEEAVKTVASYSSIVPFIAGLLIFRKSQKPIRYLTILVGIACVTELMSKALGVNDIPNRFLFHIYPVFEFTLYLFIYQIHFTTHKAKNILRLLGAFFILFCLVNTVFIEGLESFNTNGRGLESLLLVTVSISYLYSKIYTNSPPTDEEKPMFWVNTAVLMYFPLNLVFFSMGNFLYQNFSRQFNNFLWDIHAVLSFTQYVLFTIAIYLEWKKTKSPALS